MPNRLSQETSPYLRQHADNPVDWWAWGPEAFAEAKATGKPILLSVGYAACHWCHVMAHESFEDEDTANLMNSEFVNIKVDREERPDVDQIYMTALHVMQQQGGWPLTMFLTPDGEPFFGGTYYPKDPGYGMPGFQHILMNIAQAWKEQGADIKSQAGRITDALRQIAKQETAGQIDHDGLDKAFADIAGNFDPKVGGLKGAPKFPQLQLLDFIWRQSLRHADPARELLVLGALRGMSKGGIYDHLGGGYSRYSTDPIWLVPHFEKMLYDNAGLIAALTSAWQRTRDPQLRECTEDTAAWVLREMTTAGGGFASSLDADSEGVEGKFYVWTDAEITEVLGDNDDTKMFKAAYGVGPGGNWEGKTILNRLHPQPQSSEENQNALKAMRASLLEARGKRVRPARDDKVLADWNGLMIRALVEASLAFDKPDYLDAAKKAFAFVTSTMTQGDGLYHSALGTDARHNAVAEDYANMIAAALTLYEVTGDAEYLTRAHAWTDVMNAKFIDAEKGGYFATAEDATDLIVRTRSISDDAMPNANGTMISNLTRLWLLTGDNSYRKQARAVIEGFAGEIERMPMMVGSFLAACEFHLQPVQIAIRGRREQAGTEDLLSAVFDAAIPNRVLMVVDPEDKLPKGHPAYGKKQKNHQPTAYVCVGTACSLPVTDPKGLAQVLAAGPRVVAA